MTDKKNSQSYKVEGDNLLKQVRKLLEEGNIRRILIKDEKGERIFLEVPVTIGVIGVFLAPVLAAIGALAAMVGIVTIEVIRREDKKTEKPSIKKKK